MSDKVIRIGSQQGFAAQWNNAGAPSTLNLVDFEIPPGMIIDMTKSYVAFNTEIQPEAQAGSGTTNAFASDDPINAMLRLDTLVTAGQTYEAPNSSLIRNARISCDKGQIESLRRVDTLNAALFNLEHDVEERKDDMNAFINPKSVRGINNTTSYFLDCVSRNTNADGSVILAGATSRQLARDVKVPLKDVFGIAEGADAWDTSKFGTTRIHMETNWKDIKADKLGGEEGLSNAFDETTKWGQGDAIIGVAVGADVSTFTLKFAYTDYQQALPFFVGQKVLITATSSHAPISVADVPVEISALFFDPATDQVTITTSTAWFNNSHTALVNLSALIVKADNSYTPQITVNRAELVLFTRPDMQTPSEYQYVTYSTEEDSGNGITSFARGYTMEPTAEQMMVCLAPTGQILPSTVYESYRYAVNNEDQTGNRSVVPGSPLHYDRLTRALDTQYTDWRSAQLKFANLNPTAVAQADMYDKQNSTIPETLPITMTPKYVDLQIECAAGVDDLRIYKQMVKTIKA